MFFKFLAVFLLLLTSCGTEDQTPGAITFGESTTLVLIVNPVINTGSSTNITVGSDRSGVAINITGVFSGQTDNNGLAVLTGLSPGSSTITFSSGTANLTVQQDKDLYDYAVAVRSDGVEEVFAAVRYPYSENIVRVSAGESITDAISADNMIILLEAGTYPGPLTFTKEGTLIFGAWSATDGPLSVIDGAVDVRGGNTRIRGVKFGNDITLSANNFSMSFCTVVGTSNLTGNGITLFRNAFSGAATVPSSDAILVDNTGISAQ